MLNKTKSKIVIEMEHIDNASRLFKFLQEFKKISGWGGDITLSCNDFKMTIGHDIEIKNLYHDIDKTHKGKGEV